MKIGDLVKRRPKDYVKDDGVGFITHDQICKFRKYRVLFVRFPQTGSGMWFHPSKLKVISESG